MSEPAPDPTAPPPGVYLKPSLIGIIAYFGVSTVTVPFVESWWIGELAPIALIQLPKIVLINWLRNGPVLGAIKLLGFSKSPSPDYGLATPYAYTLAYLLPLGLLVAFVWFWTRLKPPYGRLLLLVLAAALVDFVFTLTYFYY